MVDSVNAAVSVGLLLTGGYAGLGLVFAAAFHAVGLKRFDHGARGAGWGFRLIITPGIVVLWPVLLALWMRRNGSDAESNRFGSRIPQ